MEGRHADRRTDIFSFGVVLYEMLTGARPFGPENAFESFAQVIYRIMSQEPVPPSSINPSVPPALDSVALRCLAKDPDGRYQDAVSLRENLAYVAGAQPAVREAALPPKSSTPPSGASTRESAGRGRASPNRWSKGGMKMRPVRRPRCPAGYVFEARPAPGTIKPRGTEVTLVVNTGQPAVQKRPGNQKKPPAVTAPPP